MSTLDKYNFVLVLSGISELNGDLEDALYESGCDDATLAFRNRVAYLEFDRDAKSLADAILSAIRDAESADPRLTVVSVEPGDSVNAAEIARRTNVSREYVRLLVQGERGEGDFPAPQSGIKGTPLVWSWADVVEWMLEHSLLEDRSISTMAETIRDINHALEMRKRPKTLERRLTFLRKLPKSKSKVDARS